MFHCCACRVIPVTHTVIKSKIVNSLFFLFCLTVGTIYIIENILFYRVLVVYRYIVVFERDVQRKKKNGLTNKKENVKREIFSRPPITLKCIFHSFSNTHLLPVFCERDDGT